MGNKLSWVVVAIALLIVMFSGNPFVTVVVSGVAGLIVGALEVSASKRIEAIKKATAEIESLTEAIRKRNSS